MMDLNKNTTDAEIMAPVHAAKAALVKQVQEEPMVRAETLAKAVNTVAEAEGVAQVRALVRDVLNDPAVTAAKVQLAVFDRLANGPDDGWSGRTNDARRAQYDGMLREAQNLRWTVDRLVKAAKAAA